ncbi:glycosyltransferase family 2 protein [Lactiplantibacillus paraplantarum]|uniref:glycosyltransferase family 2 protein n=1 Tax=Lactiplantibacillus paraplantarum TaxID=60520 RepID=UPI003DA66DAB
MKYLLNVIIPSYNSELTIGNTIDSLLEDYQTVQDRLDLKIIISDDGSEDDIQAVLKEYSNFDVTLLKNPHSGVSGARNFGIQAVEQGYILFFDSDDNWALGAFENMLDHQWVGVDIQIFNTQINAKMLKSITWNDKLMIMKQTALLEKPYMQSGVCGNVYCAEFLKENRLIFNEKLRMGEDLVFNLQTLSEARNVYMSDVKSLIYSGEHSRQKYSKENLKNEIEFNAQIEMALNIKSEEYKDIDHKSDEDDIYTQFCLNGLSFLVTRYFINSQVKLSTLFHIRNCSRELKQISRIYPYQYALYKFSQNKGKYTVRKKDRLLLGLLNKHAYMLATLFTIMTN